MGDQQIKTNSAPRSETTQQEEKVVKAMEDKAVREKAKKEAVDKAVKQGKKLVKEFGNIIRKHAGPPGTP